MKIKLDHYYDMFRDHGVQLGIDWYKHHKKHKHKGFTISLFFFRHVFTIMWVDNYDLYQRDLLIGPYRKDAEKRMQERLDRLKKIRDKHKKS